MKTIILLILSTILSFGIAVPQVHGQTKEEKKKAKAEKKRLKEEKELAEWNEAKAFAASKRYVFSANQTFTIDGSFGSDPKLNFFSINNEEAILQFALNGVLIGGNGVGGITWTNEVLGYKIVADNPKKPIIVYINLKPITGQGIEVRNMTVTFYNNGYGEVDLGGSGVRLNGNITKPERANIYEGASF